MTTFRAIAEASDLEVVEYESEATGRLVRGEDRLYSMETIVLRPRIIIADEAQVDKAWRLLDKAAKACLISRSARSQVEMKATIKIAEPLPT